MFTRTATQDRSSKIRRSTHALTALGVTGVLVLAAPLAASAHVRISPIEVAAGADDTQLTFVVPNESATATTTRVQIDLPTATPFGDVSYEPVAGWSAEVVISTLPKPAKIEGTTVTEAPTSVIWTADSTTKLAGGQFQQFVLEVGPMPDTGRIELPTTQTYSDGTVARWNEAEPASGDEPEHPAPTIYIRDTPPADSSGLIVAAESPADAAAAGAQASSTQTALVVAVIALVVAVAGLATALVAVLRRRRVGVDE